ncbi:MAG TPA: BrnT family toxin [Candidatus Hydrogenedentes bacterium]|nr:BrnT family toxin [Candidatus Hydrogenedentota bacterium]HNT89228.1 BrnT family toxin [Candidatus Hydrogenedentota bacterium]
MQFAWDEAKRKENTRKHRLDLADVPAVFDGPMYVALDTRMDCGEDRWVGIGFLGTAVVVLVFTETAHGTIRIISARKAEKHEREKFKKQIGDRLGLSGL